MHFALIYRENYTVTTSLMNNYNFDTSQNAAENVIVCRRKLHFLLQKITGPNYYHYCVHKKEQSQRIFSITLFRTEEIL